MRVFLTIPEVISASQTLPRPLGLVPTMGYLHQGHLALTSQALRECATVAATIFVNPTQFSPDEDYANYPRNLHRDLRLLENAGVRWVFTPTAADIYPSGFNTWVTVGALTERLEGAHRPGHMQGVTTVVTKLLNIVRPDRAYFGEKDAQQLRVITKLVEDLDMRVQVIPVATVREPDGLAMSSRNVNLNSQERQAALCLYQSLKLAAALYARGERNAKTIQQRMHDIIKDEPLAQIDYISIADNKTLEELTNLNRPALVSLAVKFGNTRLIDNITVGLEQGATPVRELMTPTDGPVDYQ